MEAEVGNASVELVIVGASLVLSSLKHIDTCFLCLLSVLRRTSERR